MSGTLLLQAATSGLLVGGVYSLTAMGLSLIFGVMRVVNFAHGDLMVLGMYISYWLFVLVGLDPYISIVANAAVLFGLGFLLQRYVVHRILESPEEMQFLLLLGVGLVLQNLLLLGFGPNFRTVQTSYSYATLWLGGIVVDAPRVAAFTLAMVLALALYLFLQRTRIGTAIRAAADNRQGALVIGINVPRVYATTFGIGGICVGAAGALMVPFFEVFPFASFSFTLTSFVVVILGGMGSLSGALVGGLLVGVAEALGAVVFSSSLKQVVSFSLLVLILLLRPQGVMGGKA